MDGEDEKHSGPACWICEKSFSSLSSVLRHMRNIHKQEVAIPGTNSISCSICASSPNDGYKCNRMCTLREHLEKQHSVQFNRENHVFKSSKEFTEWKLKTEKETDSEYVKKHGVKRVGNMTKIYYYCNRSGHYIPKGNKLRSLKKQGSKKINGNCPAMMNVAQIGDDVFEVEYFSTHIGHKNDLGHLTLQKKDKEWITEQLAKGFEFKEILNTIRDSANGSLEKLHLITRKDIKNLEVAYNIEGQRTASNRICMESWVHEMHCLDGQSPILAYKPQGRELGNLPEVKKGDYFLAVMNEIQSGMLHQFGKDCVSFSTTRDLTALLVADDTGLSFPVAFLFSSSKEEATLSAFLKLIKDRVGNISTQVLMTDFSEVYYNVWKKIMGDVNKWLLSTWDIDQDWRRNITKIIGREKKRSVYKTLLSLLEVTDGEVFYTMLDEVMHQLESDPDTMEFVKYFAANYSNKSQVWANCHRTGAGVGKNMHLESMHKTLKNMYLKSRKSKSLDRMVTALMLFLHDKIYDKMVTQCDETVNRLLINLQTMHRSSLEWSVDAVVKEDDNGWSIQLSTLCKETYRVTAAKKDCKCDLVCDYCKTCIHAYSCSCPDYVINWNVCKHIHLVSGSLASGVQESLKHEDIGVAVPEGIYLIYYHPDNQMKEIHVDGHVAQIMSAEQTSFDDMQQLKVRVLEQVDHMKLKINQACSYKQLLEIQKVLEPVNSTIDAVSLLEQ